MLLTYIEAYMLDQNNSAFYQDVHYIHTYIIYVNTKHAQNHFYITMYSYV